MTFNRGLSAGKGKTPLRRGHNVAVKVKARATPTSCEKSCQVSSEQIKADTKAAAESRRGSRGVCTDPADAAVPRSRGRPWAGPVGRAAPAAGASGPVSGGGRGADGGPLRSNADRTAGLLRTSTYSTPEVEAASTEAAERPGPHSTNAEPRCPPPVSPLGHGGAANSSQQTPAGVNSIPRRPLTRSHTRMCAQPLLPETGEVGGASSLHAQLSWSADSCTEQQFSRTLYICWS